MFSLLEDIVDATVNTTKVILAPVAIEASLVNAMVKPLADATDELTESVRDLIKD